MARKRYSDEDYLSMLREIELQLSSGSEVPSVCRSAGIGDATYYTWRKKFGRMGLSARRRCDPAAGGDLSRDYLDRPAGLSIRHRG